VQVGFCEDGPSLPHEVAFAAVDGPDLVGARLLPAEVHTPHSVVIGEHDLSAGAELAAKSATSEAARASVGPSASAFETMQTLLCHEHPAYLKKALLSAKQRLVIISPWIRDSVIDWGFVSSLEALLRNGVEVSIGYGIAEADGPKKNSAQDKPDITPGAERDLKELAKRYANFNFVYVGNTHRKSLVCDDNFAIITSFNWLSFKGDSRGKPRDERGHVYRKRTHVNKVADEDLRLLSTGKRIGALSGNGRDR
jgi:phosphatidylserine/phosphatidylglycerophosphate/cardiolipin synthase-like enzyme